jgi:hypothetical protein
MHIYKNRKLLSVGLFLTVIAMQENASAILTDPGIVTLGSGMTNPNPYGLNANYMWDCGGAETCPPTQGPNLAEFQLTFNYSTSGQGAVYSFGHGNVIDPSTDLAGNNRYALSIIADEYYALYINNSSVVSSSI